MSLVHTALQEVTATGTVSQTTWAILDIRGCGKVDSDQLVSALENGSLSCIVNRPSQNLAEFLGAKSDELCQIRDYVDQELGGSLSRQELDTFFSVLSRHNAGEEDDVVSAAGNLVDALKASSINTQAKARRSVCSFEPPRCESRRAIYGQWNSQDTKLDQQSHSGKVLIDSDLDKHAGSPFQQLLDFKPATPTVANL